MGELRKQEAPIKRGCLSDEALADINESSGGTLAQKPRRRRRRVTREDVESLRGKFRGKGLMKALMAEKKRERER